MNEQQLRRLSDCEVHINKYHDKLDVYMIQCDNYSKQIISKSEFLKHWEEFNSRNSRDFGMLRKDIQEINDKNKDLFEKVKVLTNDIANHMNNHHEMIKKNGKQVEKLLFDSENSQMKHDGHIKRFEDSENTLKNHETALLDLQKFKKDMMDFVKVFNLSQVAHKNNIEDLYKMLGENKNSSDNFTILLQQLDKEYKKGLSEVMKQNELAHKNLNDKIFSVDIEAHRKIDSLPKPEKVVLPDFPKMLEDQQADTLQKVNVKSKGIDQALEQAKINELQMIILDKKLEKILGILSNNDLK